MNKGQFILVASGFALGIGTLCLRNHLMHGGYVKKGDKGPEVVALQRTINTARNAKVLPEDGLFSKELQEEVDICFYGTGVYKNGMVEKDFLKTLATVYEKSNYEVK